jgi:hypothetical protein
LTAFPSLSKWSADQRVNMPAVIDPPETLAISRSCGRNLSSFRRTSAPNVVDHGPVASARQTETHDIIDLTRGEKIGTLENAQAMAAHESPRTTKLYDRTGDEITLDEVERISI